MKRLAVFLSLFVIALLVVSATPSDAWRGGGYRGGGGGYRGGGGGYYGGGGGYQGGHGRFYGRPFVGVPGFWWARPYQYWGYYGSPYYAAPYYPAAPYYSSPVIVQPPPSYVEAAPSSSAEAPTQTQEPQAYWYYCASAGAYYPTAPRCPEVWIKVPPRSE